jgi:hypothetical protein
MHTNPEIFNSQKIVIRVYVFFYFNKKKSNNTPENISVRILFWAEQKQSHLELYYKSNFGLRYKSHWCLEITGKNWR